MIAEVLEEHPQMSAKRLCELLGVGRSWYYGKPSGEEKGGDLALRDAVERTVLEFPGYGYRRVTKALQRQGRVVNHKRVLRVMREESLLCQIKKRFKATTDSSHSSGRYPNLLKGDVVVDAPDRAWSADITYIRLPEAFCYLASVIDEYSRYCVGWHLSRFIDTSLALAALEMALLSRRPEAGLIHHSDQGVQYASDEYVARLEEAGARISMAGKASPFENAKAESFFRSLKMEEVYLKDYRDFEEAEENIGEFIEEVYNRKRLHSGLGYLPPVEFEAAHALKAGS